jgi:hypothetical protein
LTSLVRILVGVVVFVLAFTVLALVIGGAASLAGFGIGGIEAGILAAAALAVTVFVVRRIRLPAD